MAYGTTSKRTANSYLTIQSLGSTTPVISLDARTAAPGGLVWASGAGYGTGEKVQIAIDKKVQATVVAGAGGTFSNVGITVPPLAQSGSHIVAALGSSTRRSAVSDLAIVPLVTQLAVAPIFTMPGSQVVMSGSGYLPAEHIALALGGIALETRPSYVTTDADGSFTATALVPQGSVDGAADMTAIGGRSRALSLATITITHGAALAWYFTGDDTVGGDTTQLALLNTHGSAAKVAITYIFASGTPMTTTTMVPAHSRVTVDVNTTVGSNRTVSMRITANLPIGAAATLFRAGHDFATMVGASTPATKWYLAEGYTGLSFKETIHVLNPAGVSARVRVQLLPSGIRAGTTVDLVVPALSSANVAVNANTHNQSLSAIVSADQGIVVARSEEFGAGGDGLTQSLGVNVPSPTWLFAMGATTSKSETYLTVFNPNPALTATVTASFFQPSGTPIATQTISVAPLHRAQIAVGGVVHAGKFAVILTADIPIVAEEPLYFGPPNSAIAGGSDVLGRNGASTHWIFPTGNTGVGYSEFVSLQNPSATTTMIEATFYGVDGKVTTTHYSVPSRGSITINVNKDVAGLVPGPHGMSVHALNGVPFVAEESLSTTDLSHGDATTGIAQ